MDAMAGMVDIGDELQEIGKGRVELNKNAIFGELGLVEGINRNIPYLDAIGRIIKGDRFSSTLAWQPKGSAFGYIQSRKLIQKSRKKEHHLWQKRDQAGSGQKAMNLVRTICGLPNEREAVYGALDEWIAWETKFPLIAATKALRILRSRNQWKRLIQVAKWMLSKGQRATMATYDLLLLAFDMDRRLDEAKMLWDMILRAHDRSISKRLFSKMISLYDHHNLPNNVIEVFADMEELGVKPDKDTVRRIGRAFEQLSKEESPLLASPPAAVDFNTVRVKAENKAIKNEYAFGSKK
ncbi:Pentatricopeptide repeat superfamily protein [Perilla frutescens var. frutescens]|nr:Pentatricopeptide repeat superfamily protein [Perilla frutescens var. frutescens]